MNIVLRLYCMSFSKLTNLESFELINKGLIKAIFNKPF